MYPVTCLKEKINKGRMKSFSSKYGNAIEHLDGLNQMCSVLAQLEGRPETQKPRNHTALRGSLLTEVLQLPGGGYPQLSPTPVLSFSSLLLGF